MKNVIHIGVGKTATTTLQRFIFPKIATQTGYIFNDPTLKNYLYKSCFMHLSSDEIYNLKRNLDQKHHFLSLESLAGWNPALWEAAADRNLKLIDSEAHILITLRDPIDWMTSVYQQKIHEGNVINPHNFFVSKENYDLIKPMIAPSKLEYFCSDFVDFEHLYEIYASRFKKVTCVDLNSIKSMNFAQEIFKIDNKFKNELQIIFESSRRENRSFSKKAMSMTLAREKALRAFGLKSLGSSDLRQHEMPFQNPEPNYKSHHKHDNFIKNIFLDIIEYVWKRVPTWRRFIQKFIDVLLPYQKYELPKNVYLNNETIEKSRNFIEKVNAQWK